MDILHMMVSDANSPFITVLAIDPHIIVRGIEHSLPGLFNNYNISGHDYIRNIVQLPFFIQSQGMVKPQRHALERERTENRLLPKVCYLLCSDMPKV